MMDGNVDIWEVGKTSSVTSDILCFVYPLDRMDRYIPSFVYYTHHLLPVSSHLHIERFTSTIMSCHIHKHLPQNPDTHFSTCRSFK